MEVLRAILIHLVVPAAGLFLYWRIYLKMKKGNVENPPYIALFILFGAYGGWLMILLTLMFWHWSGMASLGGIILISVVPIIMLGMSIYFFQTRKVSKYHYGSYIASLTYICLVAALASYRVFF